MTQGRQIARNAGALALSRVGTLGLNFLVWVHLARTLGTDGYGLLTFGTSLLSYFVLVVALGFDPVTVREIAREPSRVRSLVPDVLGVRLALALAVLAVYVVVVAVLPRPDVSKTVLFVLGGLVVVRAIQLDWVYQGVERMGVLAVRDIATSAVVAAVVFAFVRRPEQVVWAAVALVAAPALSNGSLFVAYAREHGVPRPRVDRRAWLALLAPALPLAASSFVSEVYYSLDKVMLEFLRTTGEVGLYGAGYKLFALAIAPASVLSPAFYPALSSALGNASTMVQRGADHAHALLALGLPASAAGAVLAPDLVAVIYGPEYEAAVPAVRLLFLNAAVVYGGMAYGVPLMTWDRQSAYMRAVLVGGVANVALNVALILPFGTVGAATATWISEALVLGVMASVYRTITGTLHSGLWLRSLAVAAGGAAAPAAAAAALGAPLWLSVAVSIVGTALAAWAAGLITPALLNVVLGRGAETP